MNTFVHIICSRLCVMQSEEMPEQNHTRVRNLIFCPRCNRIKCVGDVLCLVCHRQTNFRQGNTDTQALIDRYEELLGAIETLVEIVKKARCESKSDSLQSSSIAYVTKRKELVTSEQPRSFVTVQVR